jgi:mitochondrial distribution and morphology protein 12
MSFDINWSILSEGLQSMNLKETLNSKFSTIQRPDFLGPIVVEQLDFGTLAPEIAILDITDPMEDFYDQDSFEESTQASYQVESVEHQGSELDVQLEIGIMYKGDLKMSITTELIVNQPTLQFMVLPLHLTLTKTHFKTTAIIAYLQNRVMFCLKEEDEPVIRDVSIESAIGDGNKQGISN